MYQAHGVELPFDLWVQIVGSTTIAFHPQKHLEERLGRPLPQDILDARIRQRTELVLAEALMPGVLELVDAAAATGLKLGVASSSTREWVTGHLTRLGIFDRFACLRCRDDVANAKPEPDLYLAVIDCLGVTAAQAVAIEDSPNGITAAKRAGLFAVAVPNSVTSGLDFGGADVVVPSLAGVRLHDLLALG